VVCAEPTYNQDITAAFTPVMGQTYFTPTISLSESKPKSKLHLSCGGGHVSDLEVYAVDKAKTAFPGAPDLRGVVPKIVSKDPKGNIITGTLAARKMDGGYENFMEGWKYQYGKHRGKVLGKTGKMGLDGTGNYFWKLGVNLRRRSAPNRNIYPLINAAPGRCGYSNPKNTRYAYGDYRQNYTTSTTSCCPLKGIPRGTWNSAGIHGCVGGFATPNSVPHQGDWWISPTDMAHTCYQGLYGVTDHCKTDFDIKIEVCSDCSCVSANKDKTGNKLKELVRITTNHTLTTKLPGCKPWFAVADAGMRAYLGTVRSGIVADKAKECGAQ